MVPIQCIHRYYSWSKEVLNKRNARASYKYWRFEGMFAITSTRIPSRWLFPRSLQKHIAINNIIWSLCFLKGDKITFVTILTLEIGQS